MAKLIGTGTNQVPTNGMLGGMAFQSPEDVTVKKIQEEGYNVVTQTDIGTAPNQIPLNQFLGGLAYMDSVAGLDFSATSSASTGTVTSQILDDYEEGTWTPQVWDGTSGGNQASSVSFVRGTYTKIGRLCHLSIDIRNINTTGMTGGNTVFIKNLPFLIFGGSSSSIFVGTCGGSRINVDSNCWGIYAFVNASATNQDYIRLFQGIDVADHTSILVQDFTNGTNELFITITVPVV